MSSKKKTLLSPLPGRSVFEEDTFYSPEKYYPPHNFPAHGNFFDYHAHNLTDPTEPAVFAPKHRVRTVRKEVYFESVLGLCAHYFQACAVCFCTVAISGMIAIIGFLRGLEDFVEENAIKLE